MAKVELHGFDLWEKQIASLHKKADGLIKRAVYEGAGVAVRAVESAIRNDLYINKRVWFSKNDTIQGISKEQQEGLLDGLGLSPMENDDGFINTKLGFAGYNNVITKAYPKGQPNALIARAIESGTSQRPATHFVANAISRIRNLSEEAMQKQIEIDLKKLEEK